MNTTPYGVQQNENGEWEVWQMWWGKKVAGPFATRQEAQDEAVRQKRANG